MSATFHQKQAVTPEDIQVTKKRSPNLKGMLISANIKRNITNKIG